MGNLLSCFQRSHSNHPQQNGNSLLSSLYEPLPRWGHSLCEYNKRLYLVGGKGIPTSSVDVFDPSTFTWKQKKINEPTPDAIINCAYTIVDNKAFFFGGRDKKDVYHNDLWALDLKSLSWEKIQPRDGNKLPFARRNAGLAGYNDMLILYGGKGSGHCFDDIWFFNISDGTWTSPDVTGTPPPKLSSFTFTQVGQQAVLFGGREWIDGKPIYNHNVYTLDLDNWHWTKRTAVSTAQPCGRYFHAACAIGTTHLLVSGGWNGASINDSWILDLQSMRWKMVNLPDGGVERRGHAIAAVVTGEEAQILYFGGYVGDDDVVAATAVISMEIAPPPTPRWGHSVCKFKKEFFLIGGKDIPTSTVNIFDPATFTWEQRETEGKPPSAIDCSAYTVVGDQAFFFGGKDKEGGYHSNLWVLDLTSLKWSKIQQYGEKPFARRNAGLVGYGDMLILYGGEGSGHTFNDIHVFDLKNSTWTSPTVTGTPPPRMNGFTFTQVGQQAVLFGGRKWNTDDQVIYMNDVYTLDLDKLHWTKKTTAGAAQACGRYCHAACAIGTTHLMVSGGWKGDAIDDSWLLDLQSMVWRKVELSSGEAERREHAIDAVVTAEEAQILYFGGYIGADVVADTAILTMEAPPVMASSPRRLEPPPSEKSKIEPSRNVAGTVEKEGKKWEVVEYLTTDNQIEWKRRVDILANKPWAPCFTTPSSGAAAAAFPRLRWKKKQLKVYFPPNPSYFVNTTEILKLANVWSSEKQGLKGIVPEFVLGDENKSDIRVQFKSNAGSWSYIGTDAEKHPGEATMVLDLARENDDYRQYIVIHEFGHALGLGHEHQASRLTGALDEEAMIIYLQKSCVDMSEDEARKIFNEDYGHSSDEVDDGIIEDIQFDPWSTMCYPISSECIKESHRDRLSDELSKMTKPNYDQRKTLSQIDVMTIKKLYPSEPGPELNDPQLKIEDIHTVTTYLRNLKESDLQSLGLALGLYLPTIEGYGKVGVPQFRTSLLTDWINGKDDVLERGGATWSSLVRALRDEGQNGIAITIENERLGGSTAAAHSNGGHFS